MRSLGTKWGGWKCAEGTCGAGLKIIIFIFIGKVTSFQLILKWLSPITLVFT